MTTNLDQERREKNAAISRKIVQLQVDGMTFKQAFEAVLNVSFDKFAGQLYDALRAK